MTAITTALARLETLMGAISALSLFAIMLAITADAFSRYFLNAPIQGTLEVVGRYLMIAAYFLALSASYSQKMQVRVDFLIRVMPGRLAHLTEALVCIGAGALFAIIGWLAALEAVDSFTKGEITSGIIAFVIWPTPALVALGSGLMALRCGVNLCGHLSSALRDDDCGRWPFEAE